MIAKEAADWLVAMNNDVEEFDYPAFLTWLKTSPEHVREFLLVSEIAQRMRKKRKVQ